MSRADLWLLTQILFPCIVIAGIALKFIPDPDEVPVRWVPDPGLVEDAEVALLDEWFELPSREPHR
jgi:hypothetical protein